MLRAAVLYSLLLIVLGVFPTSAQEGPGAASDPGRPARPATPNLGVVLEHARPAAGAVILSVDAVSVELLPGTPEPPSGASLQEIGRSFGRVVRPFGTVMAVAPPEMVLLNDHPVLPDLALTVNPTSAFEILIARLQPEEWQKLVSTMGLGAADLADPEQQALFRAVLPSGQLRLRRFENGNLSSPFDAGLVSDADLVGARLRLVQKVELQLGVQDKAGSYVEHRLASSTVRSYSIAAGSLRGPGEPRGTLGGIPVKFHVPNRPKPGQMDLDAKRFKVLTPLAGITNVGRLLARISELTSTSLSADARYAALPVQFIPRNGSAAASDLLKALAFCVTGTYRVVGPTALLTHDLRGVGAQVEILAEARQQIRARWAALSIQVRNSLAASHNVLDLLPDPGAPPFSPDQEKQFREAVRQGHTPRLSAPIAELTPAQRTLVEGLAADDNRMADRFAALHTEDNQANLPPHVDIEKPVTLMTQPSVQVILPSVDVPAEMNEFISTDGLLSPTGVPFASPQDGTLASLVGVTPRRAVLVALASARDVDATLAAMKRFGLNELWLVVSSSGVPWRSSGDTSGEALLVHALDAVRGTGIAVVPVVDLLDWGPSAPLMLRERNIAGQDSAGAAKTAAALTEAWESVTPRSHQTLLPTPAVLGTPFSSTVEARLQGLLRDIAAEPGIAGMVWRASAPPGYLERPSLHPHFWEAVGDEPAVVDFGYSDEARLSFLRRFSVDPVDINPIPALEPLVTLPGFSGPMDEPLRKSWQQFRQGADVRLLKNLLPAAQRGVHPPPLLIQIGGPQEWFGSWDEPQNDPPGRAIRFTGGVNQLAIAAKQSFRLAMVAIWGPPLTAPAALAAQLKYGVAGTEWDGYVLDFDPASAPGVMHGNPLAPLELTHTASGFPSMIEPQR